jgi:hypothetical protein
MIKNVIRFGNQPEHGRIWLMLLTAPLSAPTDMLLARRQQESLVGQEISIHGTRTKHGNYAGPQTTQLRDFFGYFIATQENNLLESLVYPPFASFAKIIKDKYTEDLKA